MEYDFVNEVKLFMIFDILGDTVRTGPLLWQIERKRLEDVKNHILDLLIIARILKKYFPTYLDYSKINDYIMCHDLPEAITGDITKFEGVSSDEIKRVTNIAIEYLASKFGSVLDFSTILYNYEDRADIESKVVNMIDKVHSSTTFIKYQSEQDIDMNDPKIIPVLRNHPFVVEKIKEGKDLADIFFEFHMKSVAISDEECERYGFARYITWPRTVCSIKGHDVHGKPLKGNYLGSDIPMVDGFKANAAFFKLGFLDKNAVALGRQFKEMLPTLWMKAGAHGPCPTIEEGTPDMLILPKNQFAVLVDEKQYMVFAEKLGEHPEIETVFIVTDSESGYRDMIAGLSVKNSYQLYRDYLDNFRINAARR